MRNILGVIFLVLAGFGAGVFTALNWPAKKVPPPAVDLSISDGGIYRVRRVVDGDTLVLENGLHVRYLGIAAPELGHFVKDNDPLGKEATERNIALVEGKNVRLELGEDRLDKYGRVVARVIVVPELDSAPAIDAGKVLIQEGLARPLGLGLSQAELAELKALEQQAKVAKAGLWGLEDRLRSEGFREPYCAAGKSNLYHVTLCSVVRRIKAQNLHRYASQDEAEAAGRQPCERCIGSR